MKPYTITITYANGKVRTFEYETLTLALIAWNNSINEPSIKLERNFKDDGSSHDRT